MSLGAVELVDGFGDLCQLGIHQERSSHVEARKGKQSIRLSITLLGCQ